MTGARWLALGAALAVAALAVASWRDRGRLETRAAATERTLATLVNQQRALLNQLAARPAAPLIPARAGECVNEETSRVELVAAAPAAPLEAPPDEELSDEARSLRVSAWAAVDDVLARGVWTEDDRQRHGPLFRALDDAERLRILTRLAAAMNSGELAPSDVDHM